MMAQQSTEKLRAMRLRGMAEAYQQQLESAEVAGLTFDERLAMLLDSHATWRENQALERRLKTSRLESEPCAEDVHYRHARQLDGAQFRSPLQQSQWVAQHQSVLLTGPTGIGKSWLAQALAHKACRDGYRVFYRPAGKLFRDLQQAQADGSLNRHLPVLTKVDVLAVDDIEVEIADRYWPYEKQASRAGAEEYVAQVRRLLSEPACVRCRFTAADEKIARDLHGRGVTVAQVAHAIWLGCAREYTTLLSSQAAAMPIASLSYFAAVIDEVAAQANTSDAYWSYVRRKAAALEQEWLNRFRSRTGSAGE